jgi:NADH-quinone oxidoreductase subunit G
MTTTEPVAEAPVDPNAVPITINGRDVVAQKGELIIAAAERNGEYIPRFCYHERMSSVGMCRMCLVEVDSGRGPQLTPTCMVTVAPGMKVETESPTTKRAQEGIIELLLANHPLDCPVCDKGGECPLQDQSFSHGPGESRFVEEKRHYEKPIAISDLVYLDRERCILCDRCTRFADEVAGDALIHFIERGNTTQVMTFPDEPFSSYFSGNTVQICPVGALTAKPYRFKARPWDLEEAESTCTNCAVGCRTVVQSSRDEVVRYMGVDSDAVNWGWLCDRGRFGFEALNSPERLTEPLVRDGDSLVPTTWSSAFSAAAKLIKGTIDTAGPSSVAIIGGARGTNEDAHAWSLLADALDVALVDSQLADGLPPAVHSLPQATINEACAASTIVLLSSDLKNEAGALYLRVRDAAEHKGRKILEFTPKATGLTRSAWRSVGYEPGTQASVVRTTLADADVVAQLASGPVVVIVGRANLAEDDRFTLAALHEVLYAVPGATVLPVITRGNVRGALTAGLTPRTGSGTADILQAAADGKIGTLVLLGADPASDVPDADLVRRGLAGARSIIAVDTFLNASSSKAAVVLPAAAYAEKAGTTTNIEGRVTRLAHKVTPRGTARADWMIAAELAGYLDIDLGVGSLADVQTSLGKIPAFAPIAHADLGLLPDGALLAPGAGSSHAPEVPDVSTRNSYDYRLVVGKVMYSESVGTAQSPSLAPLAPGAALYVHPLDLDRIGVAEGEQVTISSPRTSVVLPVTADDGVVRGTVWAPFDQPGADIRELIDINAPVIDVRVERLS